ncbi:MAG: DUF488 domain-containing protein [Chloroflexota bacterium]
MPVQLKRVYEVPAKADGVRVLVDRVWPRGVTKQAARVDEWLKDLGPSTELRRWFNHDEARWSEFQSRYQAELRAQDQQARLEHLRLLAAEGTLTLVYSAKDTEHNQAAVIAAELT